MEDLFIRHLRQSLLMAPMTNGSLLSGAGPDVPHLTILGDNRRMRSPIPIAAGLALLLTAVHAMAQERILISSEWGNVSADLADNAATRSLVEMLPLTIEMRDHLRQENRLVCDHLGRGNRRRNVPGRVGRWCGRKRSWDGSRVWRGRRRKGSLAVATCAQQQCNSDQGGRQ